MTDVTYTDATPVTATPADTSAGYCTRSDVENLWGATNVSKWADLDDDGDATNIAARITARINQAKAHIDARLRNGRYAVPLTGTDLATVIKQLAVKLAGAWIATARGIEDENEAAKKLEKEAEDQLTAIAAGKLRLDLTLIGIQPTCPFVVR